MTGGIKPGTPKREKKVKYRFLCTDHAEIFFHRHNLGGGV